MAAEMLLVGVATAALQEGVKFLYEQAGEVLRAWRARRRDPTAPPPVVVAAPAQVTVGSPHPGSSVPDPATVVTLEDLRADVERMATGELSVDDPGARTTIAALREVVEAALGAPITFVGEAPRSVRVTDVNVVVRDVRGRVAGVRLDTGQDADVRDVHVAAGNVEASGEVVGVQIGGGSESGPINAAKPARPIRILFLAANPIDTQPLRLDEEMRAIDNAVRQAEYRDRFEIDQQWAVRIGDLQEAFLRYRPDIVHFSGHGTASSEIFLEGGSGVGQAVPPNELSRLFSVLRDNIRCVVLNACYSEPQAQGIADHIDCVVGMSNEVGDAAAIEFASGFYRALGYGRDVRTAFDLGTNQIGLQGLAEEDIPRLVSKRGDAKDVSFVESG